MHNFELLTQQTIQEQIAPILDPLLKRHGFEHVRSLHWINNDNASFRKLFAYQQLKGGVIAPQWGYSIDFVPHIAAKRVAWHRTPKAARFDLFFDAQHLGLNLKYMQGIPALIESAREKIEPAVRHALDLWNRSESAEGLINLITWLKQQPGARTSAQLPLASAMRHALYGHGAEGRRELEEFIAKNKLSEKTAAALKAAFNKIL